MARVIDLDPYLRLIGEIAIRWNYADHWLGVIIWQYADDWKFAHILTAHMRAGDKASALRMLLADRENNERVTARLEEGIKAFNTLRENRNMLVHSHTYWSHDGTRKVRWTRKNKSKPTEVAQTEVSLRDLERLSREISRLNDYLFEMAAYVNTRRGRGEADPLPSRTTLPRRLRQPRKLDQIPPAQ